MKWLFCVAGILWTSYSIHANTIIWDGSEQSINIAPDVGIYVDSSRSLTVEQVSVPNFRDKFEYLNRQIHNFPFNRNYQWIRFDFKNSTSDSLWLEIDQAFLRIANLYYKDKDGQWQIQRAGFEKNIYTREIPNHLQIFALPSGQHDFFLQIECFNHPIPMKIWKATAYKKVSIQRWILYGTILGLLFFVGINSLFLFISSKRRSYLHYAILIVAYTFIVLTVMEGYALYIFPDIELFSWYLSITPLTACIVLSYMLDFLEVKRYAPKLYYLGWGWWTIITLYFLIHTLLSPVAIVINNSIQCLITQTIITIVCIGVGRGGNKIGYYAAVIFAIWSVLILLEIIYNAIGQPAHLFGVSHVTYAIFFEVVWLSYLLSLRFEWERKAYQKEKDTAQEELLEQTKATALVIQERNEILQETNEKIKIAAQAKHDFLSVVSHELRTPLNAIMGFTELLGMHELNEEQQFYIDNLDISNKNMLRMIDNILVLLDLDTARTSPERIRFNIHQQIRNAIQYYKEANENPELEVKLNSDLSTLPQYLVGDPEFLRQILDNLLNNAIKFTNHGCVCLNVKTIRQHGDLVHLLFEVRDTGIGIPIEKQAWVFEIFAQVSESYNRNYDGLGIGLPITKRLVELHGSELEMESQEGKGSTFSFELAYALN